MSSDGVSRVSIPNNVSKTIQNIREITGKQHTDDEIYAVLRECSMDPNETAQKLLFLDTFHEVRRRRDRKKELQGLNSKALEDSKLKQGGHGRGGRGASTGFSSKFSDVGGGRNLAGRRENGVKHITEGGHEHSTQPSSQKKKDITTSQTTRVSAVASNGPANQSNGSSGHGFADQSLIGSGMSVSKSNSAVSDTNSVAQPQAAVDAGSSPVQTTSGSVTSIDQGNSLSSSDQLPTSSASFSGVYSASSDPVLAPSISQLSGVNGAIDREVGGQHISDGSDHVEENKIVLHEVVDLPLSKNEKSGSMNSTSKNTASNKSSEVEKNQLSDASLLSSSVSCSGSLRSSSICGSQPHAVNASEASQACVKSSAGPRQHVTFPNHFQVPKALKTALTFGSFDNFGPTERSSNGTGSGYDASAAHKSSPGSDEATISSNQRTSLSAQGDHVEYQHSLSYPIENPPTFGNSMTVSDDHPKQEVSCSPSYPIEKTPTLGNSITVPDSKGDQPKQEVFLIPEGPPIANVHNAQNYGLNFIPTMLGTQQIQFEGAEPQAQESSHLPNFVNTSSQPLSSPSPTPPPLQSSIPVSPQSLSLFRPPYPPNFFPYGHYYPPFYVSPIHQFMSPNGFPQPPSAGNIYLPAAAAAAAAGIKIPVAVPQFKAGANTGNAAHIGIHSGSLITPPVGYAPSPTVNTGSSSGNEDLAVSQFKENQIYTTGQLSEGSGVWIPAPGQDISSLQINSVYNLPHQAHLTFPQTHTNHGAFASIYQPGQTVASPSTLLQQSQAVTGSVENVGHPSGAYHQPQHAQINWNSKF